MFNPNPEIPRRNAEKYAESHEIILDASAQRRAGLDGAVFFSTTSAVKGFYQDRQFQLELACYKRLKHRNAPEQICGFWVPQMIDFDRRLRVIEMQLVTPPYCVDFGKAYVDHTPDYFQHYSTGEMRELFGEDRAKQVMKLLRELSMKYGINYADANPKNITFGDEDSRPLHS
jgi:hypothetical protein